MIFGIPQTAAPSPSSETNERLSVNSQYLPTSYNSHLEELKRVVQNLLLRQISKLQVLTSDTAQTTSETHDSIALSMETLPGGGSLVLLGAGPIKVKNKEGKPVKLLPCPSQHCI